MLLPVTQLPLPVKVSELWHPDTQTWNVPYIANISDTQAVQAITAVPMVPSEQNDVLRWVPAKDGKCSTKNIYRHLSRQSLIQLPQQGSRSIMQHANSVLQKVWKSKDLPPLIKTFAWRLVRRALATGESASRYSVHIDKHCTVCGAVENDAHLFFQCQLPRVVWFSTNPPLRTDLLPQEQDGVQVILQTVLPTSTSNQLFSKILITLWYLWKARNDNKFNRKTWSPWQVHHAVQAHISSHQLALQDQADEHRQHMLDHPSSPTDLRRHQQCTSLPTGGMSSNVQQVQALPLGIQAMQPGEATDPATTNLQTLAAYGSALRPNTTPKQRYVYLQCRNAEPCSHHDIKPPRPDNTGYDPFLSAGSTAGSA